VPRALRELRRVLTPGGRALVMDTDWESCVWRSGDDARMRRLLDCWDEHCPHPHLPRELGRLLREAGFGDVRTHVIPIVNAEFRPDSYSAGAIDLIAGYARARVGEATTDAWARDLSELAARGEWFFSVNRYVFVARA
jgi:SAM-dependent methyltransferase